MNLASRYYGIHNELRRDLGSATTYPCMECGARAEHWAYDHADPDEVTADVYGQQLTFSLNHAHYEPLCGPCHRLRDNPPKDECKNGHPLEGDNVYVRPNGGRLCRTCKRDTLRRWRDEHPDWRAGVSA